jgi:hypothetical protein
MNTTAIKLVIKFWHDDHSTDPCEDDWQVYSFNRRHHNYRQPDEFEDDEELQTKLKVGLAFPLSYYEHGQCLWSLGGALPPGARCPWDSVGYAGLIVWEQDEGNIGAKTVEDRREDATRFINRYTMWCNGEIYGYTIEAFSKCHACGQDEEAEAEFDLPSVGGYYADDIKGMVIDMKDHIGDDWADYEVEFKEQHGYGLADEVKRLWKPTE